MNTPLQPQLSQGGLDDLLALMLPKGIGIDEAMSRVRRLYGPLNLSEREWTAIRNRVARLLANRSADRSVGLRTPGAFDD